MKFISLLMSVPKKHNETAKKNLFTIRYTETEMLYKNMWRCNTIAFASPLWIVRFFSFSTTLVGSRKPIYSLFHTTSVCSNIIRLLWAAMYEEGSFSFSIRKCGWKITYFFYGTSDKVIVNIAPVLVPIVVSKTKRKHKNVLYCGFYNLTPSPNQI